MNQSKNTKSEWLEKLQQESWQLELIVSGIVIFGLFSGVDFLQEHETKIRAFGESTTRSGIILFTAIMTTWAAMYISCLLYTSPSPRDATLSRMPSSA